MSRKLVSQLVRNKGKWINLKNNSLIRIGSNSDKKIFYGLFGLGEIFFDMHVEPFEEEYGFIIKDHDIDFLYDDKRENLYLVSIHTLYSNDGNKKEVKKEVLEKIYKNMLNHINENSFLLKFSPVSYDSEIVFTQNGYYNHNYGLYYLDEEIDYYGGYFGMVTIYYIIFVFKTKLKKCELFSNILSLYEFDKKVGRPFYIEFVLRKNNKTYSTVEISRDLNDVFTIHEYNEKHVSVIFNNTYSILSVKFYNSTSKEEDAIYYSKNEPYAYDKIKSRMKKLIDSILQNKYSLLRDSFKNFCIKTKEKANIIEIIL